MADSSPPGECRLAGYEEREEATAAGQGYCYFRTVWPFYFLLSAGLILRTRRFPFLSAHLNYPDRQK